MSESKKLNEDSMNEYKTNIVGAKRKKKRSANQMAKKFARRRDTSDHGYELEADNYQYMVRILEVLRTEFPTMDNKLNFVSNVYEQIIDHEVEYARNQVGSRVMDSLMDYADFDVICRIIKAFNSSLRPLCSDKYGSHVLEKIICVCSDRGNKLNESAEKTNDKCMNIIEILSAHVVEYNNMALKLCKYVLNNIEEFINDLYANHILRTVIKCLGGQIDTVADSTEKKAFNTCTAVRPVIQEYKDLLINTSNRILKLPQFLEFGKDEITSGFLQTLLLSLSNVDAQLTSNIIKRIINECFTGNNDETHLATIFDCESSLRLLEICLKVAEPKLFKKLCNKYFTGNLKKLALMKNTNFSVQRLLDYCSVKEEYETIFDELSDHLNSIIEKQYTGVLSSLANGCLRLQAKQGPFINAIFKCLDCDQSNRQLYIVSLISRLITYEQYESAKKNSRNIPIHLHGSLILQAILQFNKPIKIVNSILDMNGEDLAILFSDPKGSRILDAFMDSKYVGEKSRDKLAKQLKGHWVKLACGIHGSRCLDKIWQHSKDNQKLYIMEELASVGELLNSTKAGRLINIKFNVALFVRNKKDWIEAIGKNEKTKTLFAGIITDCNEKKFIKS
ncbi:hypothetical protein PV327_008047 [Microctonus hyperodae]|uniref:Uncharacterized protein n=1 Tax=Microctonus hyperodae TaxID=165561 RepID=A0AA39G0Q7_MICHY|nr:hypothetical protein PV327_008047 [Microctonus hyperodae]